jgi:hypothetical protein
VFIMASAPLDAQAPSTDQKYQALLAVSEAIVSHRDLSALFLELAGQLHQVVRFDYLGLALHDATSNTLRMHLLKGIEFTPLPSELVPPLEEEPAGWVWQTQQARILSNVLEKKWFTEIGTTSAILRFGCAGLEGAARPEPAGLFAGCRA